MIHQVHVCFFIKMVYTRRDRVLASALMSLFSQILSLVTTEGNSTLEHNLAPYKLAVPSTMQHTSRAAVNRF